MGFAFEGGGGGGLPHLLRSLNDMVDRHAGGHGWIRLMYAYPTKFNDEMIRAIADLPRVCKYIDIPLQHASNRILEAMRRNVTREHQLELMHKLRDAAPGMAIRTTFITGFPGETEADHEELLDFVEEVGFDALGVFEYSQEDGTPAGRMEQDASLAVPAEVKRRRREELMELQQGIAFDQVAYLASFFDEEKPAESGLQFDVLIDRALSSKTTATAGVESVYGQAGDLHQGRAYFQAVDIDSVTYVESKAKLSPGELVRCVVVGSHEYDLVARPLEELERRVSLKLL